MAYEDLIPVRAAVAATPEQSDHTSIQHRVIHWQQESENYTKIVSKPHPTDQPFRPDNLHPFVGTLQQPLPNGIIFNLVDYLQLVDWTGDRFEMTTSGRSALKHDHF